MPFDSKLANVGVVVLASNNNPKLLNPDFLKRNQIVPESWVPADTLVTPPFSQTVFTNGVTFQLDESRLTIQANETDNFDWKTELPAAAEKFTKTLSHVDYRSAGMNFGFVTETPSGSAAESCLIDNLLQKDSWANSFGGLSGVVLELQFKNEQPQFNLKIGAREIITSQGSKIEGFMIFANVHHDFIGEQQQERINFLKSLGDKFVEVQTLLGKLPIGIKV